MLIEEDQLYVKFDFKPYSVVKKKREDKLKRNLNLERSNFIQKKSDMNMTERHLNNKY